MIDVDHSALLTRLVIAENVELTQRLELAAGCLDSLGKCNAELWTEVEQFQTERATLTKENEALTERVAALIVTRDYSRRAALNFADAASVYEAEKVVLRLERDSTRDERDALTVRLKVAIDEREGLRRIIADMRPDLHGFV